MLILQPAAEARKGRPRVSEGERALQPALQRGGLDELARLCPQLVEAGEVRLLQKVQARLLTIKPAPQPLPVVLANADGLLRCQAPQAALRVLERYGPAPGIERSQWLLLRWQAAHAGLDHRLAAETLRDLAGPRLASLETLLLPVGRTSDGLVASRPALDLLADSLESMGLAQAAAEVLLASRIPGEATARRLGQAVALLPQLPVAERARLLELALEQAAAAGSWGLVTALLDQQLALPDTPETAAIRTRAAERRGRLSRRIDDAYGAWRLQPTAELDRQLRSPRAPGGHAAPSTNPASRP
ncbi:MAG: hypothetical protein ACKO8I_04150 [Cyanobacteriota bacterium]